MKINEKQDSLIEEFASLAGWFEKYEYLINIGEKLPGMDNKYKTRENSISGCQSQLWVAAESRDGKLVFHADSDAKITRGIIAIMLSVVNNHTPKEIYEANFYFLDKIGLKTNMSPSRVNGLNSIIKRIYDLSRLHM